ncbi:hypothetical protein DL546_008708 [Coniochaeta pulveracea]|uniref:Uncharacterized protein n=1 Tax=Coniochaeta pulveracea TaxID=177199 RepID=A0A420YE44_9PEZI|nr:hypothetical protein DL546_008708 [Coniochaeta pulveracea]
MPQIMSPSYPAPPSHSNADMNAPPPSYYPAHPHQQRGSAVDNRERSTSYQNIPRLSHSMSTPSVRDHEAYGQQSQHPSLQTAEPDQSELSLAAAEKRRNKLGYHRTSVACGMFFSIPVGR